MMPIYHLQSRILTRQNKDSERLYDEHNAQYWNSESKRGGIQHFAVERAAYRAGTQLQHESSGRSWDFLKKSGIAYSEINLPAGAPEWMRDRQKLWNAVDSSEKRKDAQLAREIVVAIPSFLDPEESKSLVRDFVNKELVSRGMVADWSIHADSPHNLHAHIMLTMRDVAPEDHIPSANAAHEIKHAAKFGFLAKNRSWNEAETLMEWREGWAKVANEHMARAGYTCRIDHRSYKEQGIDLTPGISIGIGPERRSDPDLPDSIKEQIQRQKDILADNGRKIIENPSIALKAITRIEKFFSEVDLATFLRRHTDPKQFERAYEAVVHSPELVRLNGEKTRGEVHYTTRELSASLTQ